MSYKKSQAEIEERRKRAKRIPTWKQDERRRPRGCKVCGEIAFGQQGYCYWCGKRRGLW